MTRFSNNPWWRGAAVLAALVVACAAPLLARDAAAAAGEAATVFRIRVEGIIAPSSARFIQRAILEAEESNAAALLIELDTPGGLLKSMDDITKAMLDDRHPGIEHGLRNVIHGLEQPPGGVQLDQQRGGVRLLGLEDRALDVAGAGGRNHALDANPKHRRRLARCGGCVSGYQRGGTGDHQCGKDRRASPTRVVTESDHV